MLSDLDEILTHIFTFLPIKSTIICTSVSKTWKSLIQSPTFISTYLHHSHTKNNLLLLRLSRNDKQVYTLHKEGDLDFTEHTSFDSPLHGPHLQHGKAEQAVTSTDDSTPITISSVIVTACSAFPMVHPISLTNYFSGILA